MIDFKDYHFLSKDELYTSITAEKEKDVVQVLDEIKKSSYKDFQKESLTKYAIQNPSVKKSDTSNKLFSSWMRSNAYKKVEEQVKSNDSTKFMMSSLVMIMTGTICIYFLSAIIRNSYVINFSVDAIFASIAIAVLVIQVRKKYQVLRRYVNQKDYLLMDILSFAICVLLKFMIPPMFDLSVLILFGSYYIQKRKFSKDM